MKSHYFGGACVCSSVPRSRGTEVLTTLQRVYGTRQFAKAHRKLPPEDGTTNLTPSVFCVDLIICINTCILSRYYLQTKAPAKPVKFFNCSKLCDRRRNHMN